MPKIMLVEDDNNLREIYGERLTAEGYDIVSAGDGEEALALAVKERPDLIIADVMMPKISGFDMLDILRQTPETKSTKVIIMTALSQAEDKNRAGALGADKYLVKSQVTLEDVARVVHDLLYGSPEPASPAPPTPAEPAVVEPSQPVLNTPIIPADPPLAQPPDGNPLGSQPLDSSATPPIVIPADPPVGQTTDDNLPAGPSFSQPPSNDSVLPEPAYQPVISPISAPATPTASAGDDYSTTNNEQPSEPIVNPITGIQSTSEISQTNATESATAESSQAESDGVNRQIQQFETNSPATEESQHEEPLVEPTEQDKIHAQDTVTDPVVTKSSDSMVPVADPPVIQPPTTDTPKDINRLYEEEMAKEAATERAATQNPAPVGQPPAPVQHTENPIASNPQAPVPGQPEVPIEGPDRISL